MPERVTRGMPGSTPLPGTDAWEGRAGGPGETSPDPTSSAFVSLAMGAGHDPGRIRLGVGRVAAACVTLAGLLALVGCDLWVAPVSRWWDHHSFTANVISSLLVVGVTVLLLDEIVARRQREDRSQSVAVQGLILYGQARRANRVVLELLGGSDSEQEVRDEVGREVRDLANMILIASPALFDDPEARLFLEEVQRLAALMYASLHRASLAASVEAGGDGGLSGLRACRARLDYRVRLLAARVPAADQGQFEEMADLGPLPPPGARVSGLRG
ncbi:MAG: hypothetical protein WA751_02835 [Candidatus Dormiibacterota bacterium]